MESIRSADDFRKILRNGRRTKSNSVVVVSLPGSSRSSRYGLVVSKRCGNAVRRNRIKRRLRAAIREAQLQIGTDYVIIASAETATVGYTDLVGELDRVAKKHADA